MTSKQYYKQTSDMAFQIEDWRLENNTVKAKILLKDGETPHSILTNNDFFALKDWSKKDTNDCDLDTVSFEIVFIYNSKHYMTFDIDVCDTIDCRIGGGEMVLSCDGFGCREDVNEVNGEPSNGGCSSCKCNKSCQAPLPTVFDDFMKDWFAGDNFPLLPKLDDFFEDMSEKFDKLKNTGSKFCEVSYQMDGNGNGHYRKVDNNGVVEKHFKKVDGKVKEISTSDSSNNNDPSSLKKTELKDLLN